MYIVDTYTMEMVSNETFLSDAEYQESLRRAKKMPAI